MYDQYDNFDSNQYNDFDSNQYDDFFNSNKNNLFKFISNKKIIYGILILIILIVAIIIIVLTTNKNDNFLKMEETLKEKTVAYLKSNDDDINDLNFISFETLNYTPDKKLNCTDNGGVIVYSLEDENFDFLYQCNKKTSAFLTNIKDENEKNKQYISLRGSVIVYVDYHDEYIEPGYNSDYEVTVYNNIKNQAGIYPIDYFVDDNNHTYFSTRIVVVKNTKKITTSAPVITLDKTNITLYVGEEFKEPSYKAIDEIDGDITEKVVKNTNLDINNAGTYVITYKVTNSNGYVTEAILTVEVIEDNNNYNIALEGNNIIYLDYLEEYIEPGFIAFNENDEDVTNRVIVTNNINNNIPGIYEVTYQIGNATIKRTVVVQSTAIKINSSYYPTYPTNSIVDITLNVTGQDILLIQLPDGKVSTETNLTYTVYENDDYEFKIYNKKGEYKTEIISISNIDNEPPTGICTIDNKTIKVQATDDSKIYGYSYLYNGINYSNYIDSDTYTLTSNQDNVSVKIKDVLNNEATIKCDFINQEYEPIEPGEYELANGEIIKSEETDTFKFWLVKTKNNGKTYYITRIWMKDPFNQIQKYYSYNMGLRTTTLNKLADKLESTTKKKAVVAINSNTTATINCIVIRDGKLITNNPNIVHIFRAHSSIINRDGYLQVFSDRRTTRTGRKTPADRLEEVTEQRQKIIEAEPNFVISPTRQVIRNGNAKNVGGGHAGRRTMLCQINKNNWLVFVSSSSYGTVNAATSELMKYGCTAAVNLDGGSSSALYVKTSSMSSFNTYVNPGSSHPNIYTDILYFSE